MSRSNRSPAHAAGLMLLACGLTVRAELAGLRNATAYVRVPAGVAPTLAVRFELVWAWQRCFEHVYVQAPDGSLIARRRIEAGVGTGQERVPLDRGPGAYRFSTSGQTYRAFSLATDPDLPFVVQAAPIHTAFHVQSPTTLYFRVPAGTPAFTFCLKNQGRKPIHVTVTPPGDGDPVRIEGAEQFRGLKSRATMRRERDYFHNWEYDSHTVKAPAAGVWSVQLPGGAKASVWLEGVPNLFAVSPDSLFAPVLAPGKATVAVNAGEIRGPVGLLGGSFPGSNVTKLAVERVRFLGLQSMCRYIGHSLRERENDDDDPRHINWAGFNWGAEDIRSDHIARWGAEQMVIIHPARWLGGRGLLRGTDEALEEYAEFVEALLTHYNVRRNTPIRYLSLLDEPNSTYTAGQVERLLRVVGRRVQAHADERVRATRIMAPQSSMFLRSPTHAGGSGVAMAEHLYRTCDAFAGGIAWDDWTNRNLFDTWLYGEAVRRAVEIQRQHDSDGAPEEPMAIFQTNFFGGGSIALQDTTTFYASLWWASVAAHAMKTGRMTALNWWMTFDDHHHMKGLCYLEEKGGAVKPVGYTMKMLIETLLDDAAASSSDHVELDELATVSRDRRRVNVLVVNKLARRMALSSSIRLPREMHGAACRLRVLRMGDGDRSLQTMDERALEAGEVVVLERELDGESIYVFDIQRPEP